MSRNQQTPSRQWGKTALIWLYRSVAMLLVVGIVISAIQVVTAWSQQQETNSMITERQADYVATATAIAPKGDAAANRFHFVQFATNTPDAPQATEVPPQATQAPAQTTLIPLPTFYFVPDPQVETIAGTQVPPRAPLVDRQNDLINIVLLGSDGDIVEDNSVRTDTVIIVSINRDTGTVSMLNIPRDVFVYVPTPSLQRINTVYGIGENLGWSGGGFGLLRETIFYNFGIQVHYHAFVEITGMVQIIDTLGGVEVAVDCAYQDPPLYEADVPEEAIGPDEDNVYILPVGYYEFTGREAMWWARSRGNSDTFDRGRRHIQLMESLFRAARDEGQITQIPTLWSELTQIIETDIPLNVVIELLPIALELDSSRIERFNLVRTDHTIPWTPTVGAYEGQNVQLLNRDRVFSLMTDFYTPPPASRLSLAGASIGVYNGTDQSNLDLVASERLRNAGLNAVALGSADESGVINTTLTDYAATSRGSATGLIVGELNIDADDITIIPDPNREWDYIVTVGETYNSCPGGVLPIE